jgi:hypothetical protein
MNSAIKERPIRFSGGMVRAILDGSKTQTRRVAKHHRDMEFDLQDPHYGPYWLAYAAGDAMGEDAKVRCPYGTPGDRLFPAMPIPSLNHNYCAARFGVAQSTVWAIRTGRYWQHAPKQNPPNCQRWASRILLEITDVRVQRLQDISEEDAWAEGCEPADVYPRDWFHWLWDTIYGGGSWDANPWVWAITFRRLEP